MALTTVPVAPLPPDRFKEILSPEQSEQLDRTIERAQRLLEGRVVWNVNSTARGGGVAEMLQSLIAYTRGGGVDARWLVIEGNPEFFEITKRIHNRLHGSEGDGGPLGPHEQEVYAQTTAANAGELAELAQPDDLFLLHDPQTAGLVRPLEDRAAQVVWRCHVGVDVANDLTREVWGFLLPHLKRADGYVFTRTSFVWEGLDDSRVTIIPPSIDAFSPKNQALEPEVVKAILCASGLEEGEPETAPVFTRKDGTPGRVDRGAELDRGGPLPAAARVLLQVSRWDRLKDHSGVLQAFAAGIATRSDAHLVLAGPSTAAVADDPEGLEVLEEIKAAYDGLPAGARERAHLVSLPMQDPEENAAMVNALQRRAEVVAQKSLAEGFGLTVSEAMWKARPVVASGVGGIRDQIRDGDTGVLVDSTDLGAFADAVVGLFDDPERARGLGERARDEVRSMFLGPRHLTQWVDLFEALLES